MFLPKISSHERRNHSSSANSNSVTLDLDSEPSVLKPSQAIPEGGLEAWLQVLGSWVILAATWGLAGTFGIYQTYYERELLPNSSASAISWVGSLPGALSFILAPISGTLYDAGYFRQTLWFGVFLILLGQFMTSLATTYWQVLLAQGICVGLGCGLAYVPSTAILSQYFHRKRALVIGIASTGAPVVGIIFPVIFGRLQPTLGFGWTTRIIAFILLGLSIIPVGFMHTRIPPSGQIRSLIDTSALRDPVFCLVMAGSFFVFLTLYIGFFYVQLFAVRNSIGDASFLPYFITIMNAGSIPGRVLPSHIADRIGALETQIAVTALSAIMMYGWLGVYNVGGLITFAFLYGLFSGGLVGVTPSLIATLSPDPGRLGTRMGMMFFVSGVATLVGLPVAGVILGDYSEVRWLAMIGYAAGALTLGAIFYTLAWVSTWKLKIQRSV
ncbi:hypothetical protein QQX98_007179 [Neonectria punicea]|uniref:Major facilitator superfamily (MFS) profile domain-containing protein n=1 Tax=Neonectria punicea TaxID=979145 RepID=A0ABR1GZ71_9HYPO